MTRRLLLLSSSNVHGLPYLSYAEDTIKDFFNKNEDTPVTRVLFIPYALKDYDKYADTVSKPFKEMGLELHSIHFFEDPIDAINKAEAIFIGGGNTFKLLSTLYSKKLIEPIRKRVLQDGIPFMGSSAGTNVATTSIHTTNDMPIVWVPSFEGLKLIPFNINPHFIDADVNSTHKGETRETRIAEYHSLPGTPPVLGLREGSILSVEGDTAVLKGVKGAKLFQSGEAAVEYNVEDDVSFLMKEEIISDSE